MSSQIFKIIFTLFHVEYKTLKDEAAIFKIYHLFSTHLQYNSLRQYSTSVSLLSVFVSAIAST